MFKEVFEGQAPDVTAIVLKKSYPHGECKPQPEEDVYFHMSDKVLCELLRWCGCEENAIQAIKARLGDRQLGSPIQSPEDLQMLIMGLDPCEGTPKPPTMPSGLAEPFQVLAPPEPVDPTAQDIAQRMLGSQ